MFKICVPGYIDSNKKANQILPGTLFIFIILSYETHYYIFHSGLHSPTRVLLVILQRRVYKLAFLGHWENIIILLGRWGCQA